MALNRRRGEAQQRTRVDDHSPIPSSSASTRSAMGSVPENSAPRGRGVLPLRAFRNACRTISASGSDCRRASSSMARFKSSGRYRVVLAMPYMVRPVVCPPPLHGQQSPGTRRIAGRRRTIRRSRREHCRRQCRRTIRGYRAGPRCDRPSRYRCGTAPRRWHARTLCARCQCGTRDFRRKREGRHLRSTTIGRAREAIASSAPPTPGWGSRKRR